MAGFNRPGKSPNKLARLYKQKSSTNPNYIRISLNTTATYGGVVDAPIREANPTINYSTADFQGNPKFEVGYNATGDRTNTVIKFGGLSSVGTGYTVRDARLRIFCLYTDGIIANVAVLNSVFDVNTVTWNIRQTATNWVVAGGYGSVDLSNVFAAQAAVPVGSPGVYIEFMGAGINAYVQSVINGGVDNGLLLYNNTQSGPAGTSSYVSSEGANGFRPELIFQVTTAAATPPVAIRPFYQGSSVSTAATLATTSITPVANKLYLATVTSLTVVSVVPSAPTITGCGITWVNYANSVYDNSGTSLSRITLFYGLSAAPTAGVLTVDFGAQLQDTAIVTIDEASNVNTTSPIVQGATNANSTAATDLIVTLAPFADVKNATYATFAKEATVATASLLSGLSSLNFFDVATKISNFSAYASGNVLNPWVSWSASCQNGGIAVELKSASSTANSITLNGAANEDQDVTSGAIASLVSTNGAALEAQDVTSSSVSTVVTASGNALEGYDIVLGSALTTAPTALNATITEQADTTNGVIASNVSLNAAPIETPDVTTGAIASLIALSSNRLEQPDIATGTIASQVSLSSAVLENNDVTAGSIASLISTNGAAFEISDVTNGIASSVITASGAVLENTDVANGNAIAPQSIVLNSAITEQSDSTTGSATSLISTNGNALEASDTVAASISSSIALTGNNLERPDVVTAVITSQVSLAGAAIEAPDFTSATLATVIGLNAGVLEATDVVNGTDVTQTISFNAAIAEVNDLVSGSAILPITSFNAAMLESSDRVTGLIGVTTAVTKQGGDDVPREEYWEKHVSKPRRDANLDKLIQEAYSKATEPEKPIVEVVKAIEAVKALALDDDDDEDDIIMLLLGL